MAKEKKYRIAADGVFNRETGGFIPNAPGNNDWMEYLEWLAENEFPDPELTPEQLTENLRYQEVSDIEDELVKARSMQFRMLMTMWDIGVEKGLWNDSDIKEQKIKDKKDEWKDKLDRLSVLGE